MKEGLLEQGGDEVRAATPRQREYYIDWMRVIAIYMVVSYHTVQGLNWVEFYNNVPGAIKFVISFRASALQIGMPMFFHISGRAHALSPAMGFRKTVVQRANRLLVPFVVCYTLLIPPWQYIDKCYDWQHPSVFHMKANPIEWFLEYYTTARFLLYFDLAWLWFLPALFFIIVFSSPLFILAERYSTKSLPWAALWCIVFWGLLAIGLVQSGFTALFVIFTILGPISALVISGFIQLPSSTEEVEDEGQAVRMCLATHVYTLIQVACSVGIVLSFRYADIDPVGDNEDARAHSPRACFPFIILCMGFYVHGFFVQRWSKGIKVLEERKSLPWWFWQYKLFGAFTLVQLTILSSPQGDVETGHFIYPIYSASYKEGSGFGAMHVLGTWAYIAVFVALFQAYCNQQGGARFHKHATRSTIVVYIFHWIFVKIFCFWWLNPTLWRHKWIIKNAWMAFLITVMAMAVCCALSLSIYMLLVTKAPRVGKLFGL